MQRHTQRHAKQAASLVAVAGLAVVGALTAPAAQGAPTNGNGYGVTTLYERPPKGRGDNFGSPMSERKTELKQAALERRLKGDAAMQGKVAKVGNRKFVELQREATDPVFVLLVEFGDEQYPNPIFQNPPPDGSTTDVTGPMHNEIPPPDRSVDNSTLWKADYNKAHYEDMYFTRMAKYFRTQSSNRYSVRGDVNGWVKVPFNQALYGRNYCGDIVCSTTKALARDAMAVWVQQQLDAGKTAREVRAYLKQFDKWDRYDIDGDGNFDEPDGFIDHMQLVHAGGDEAAGDPQYGTDAIWSHRWYANLQAGGPGGLVGFDVGSNSGLVSSDLVPDNPVGMWVGDYTIQPENGGLGVFAHEYAHDLGLPDLYDTSGNTGGAENSTGFWTLMSSGANIGGGGSEGIGDSPTDLSSWELFQLGWLNAQGDTGPFYEIARAGETSTHKIGHNVPATRQPQAVFVVLPEKQVPLELGPVAAGTQMFWSTRGDDLNTSMTKTGVSGTSLTAKVRYDAETDFDYAFLEASSDGGTNWVPVATNLSDTSGDQSGFNDSQTGITGTSPGFPDAWVDLTATLPSGTNAIRFRYQTDGGVAQQGFFVDEIAIDGTLVGTAESDEGWTFAGFVRTGSSSTQSFFNAYVLERRRYDRYDKSLRTGYNFGFLNTQPDKVEFFPYQDGLLVWYWDESYGDNNVGEHPGGGLLLPVDAHPSFYHTYDGHLVRPRLLSFDSTFGRDATDAITIHKDGQPTQIPSRPAVRTFDDTKTWWFNSDEHAATGAHVGRYQPGWYGVDVPKTGTTVTVDGAAPNGNYLKVTVAPKG